MQLPDIRISSVLFEQLFVRPSLDDDGVVHVPNTPVSDARTHAPEDEHSQNQIGVTRKVSETVRREEHRLAPTELAKAVEEVCATMVALACGGSEAHVVTGEAQYNPLTVFRHGVK